tara:strand:- start:350 stop:688 length:339 start_codon:yes stop_codon:yes gene_type:complete
MAYKQSPFPTVSGTSGHRSALKQREELAEELATTVGDAATMVRGGKAAGKGAGSATAEGKEKTKMVEGTTVFGKTLSEWNAIISKYAGKPNLPATAQTLLSKARNAVSKLKD